MKKAEMKTASNEQLVRRYQQLAEARGLALYDNDPRAANRAFREEVAILKEMESRQPSAISELRVLLNSDNPWVRHDSATPLLFFYPKEAEKVLEQLTTLQPGILRAETNFTLDQWRQGQFKHWW